MLGDNIRNYRKLNNMSQDELAEKLDVTRQSISLWETGQTQPTLENIVALAKLFNVSTDQLLSSDGSDIHVSSGPNTPKQQQPNKKTQILFVVLCVALVAALATIVLVLIGGNGLPSNDDGPDTTQASAAGATVSDNVDTTDSTQASATTASVTDSTTEGEPFEEEKDIFGYLKDFVIENGTINGDYCYYAKSADNYGGDASKGFSLYYWGDTDKIEFCLHNVIDDTFSINFYLYVPKDGSSNYDYVTSYYYRSNGESLYEARGTIRAEEFTDNYPLNCTYYFGSTDEQNDFMEISRQGICDLIRCLDEFIEVENIKYSFEEFGFLKF